MSGVLKLYPENVQETGTKVLKQFAAECIQENKASVIQLISTLKQPNITYIIETITYKIMNLVMAAKSKEDILKYIAGGTYDKLTQLLIEGFLADPDIISSTQKKA